MTSRSKSGVGFQLNANNGNVVWIILYPEGPRIARCQKNEEIVRTKKGK